MNFNLKTIPSSKFRTTVKPQYYLIFTLLFLLFSSFSAYANSWQEIQDKAKGQTVYWNAWGGSEEINAYITGLEAESKKITE